MQNYIARLLTGILNSAVHAPYELQDLILNPITPPDWAFPPPDKIGTLSPARFSQPGFFYVALLTQSASAQYPKKAHHRRFARDHRALDQ